MASVEGADKLAARLRELSEKAARDAAARVAVGYGAPYALRVHEDLEAHHENGQAKFLEQPARELRKEMAAIVARAVREGKSLAEADLEAAEFLKAASQALCPVKSGALRASAFVRQEGG